MNPYQYLSPAEEAEVRATIAKGEERSRNGEANRPLTMEQYAAWRADRVNDVLDEQAMAEWEGRGFVSGNPHDRMEHPDNPEPSLATATASEPDIGDYWLQPSHAPTAREWFAPLDSRKGMYPPRGDWGAAEDAIDALMSEDPDQTHEGGGLTGVEDDYWLARKLMSRPPHPGPENVREG